MTTVDAIGVQRLNSICLCRQIEFVFLGISSCLYFIFVMTPCFLIFVIFLLSSEPPHPDASWSLPFIRRPLPRAPCTQAPSWTQFPGPTLQLSAWGFWLLSRLEPLFPKFALCLFFFFCLISLFCGGTLFITSLSGVLSPYIPEKYLFFFKLWHLMESVW